MLSPLASDEPGRAVLAAPGKAVKSAGSGSPIGDIPIATPSLSDCDARYALSTGSNGKRVLLSFSWVLPVDAPPFDNMFDSPLGAAEVAGVDFDAVSDSPTFMAGERGDVIDAAVAAPDPAEPFALPEASA